MKEKQVQRPKLDCLTWKGHVDSQTAYLFYRDTIICSSCAQRL